jgi:ADP-ribose pyrophosphatase
MYRRWKRISQKTAYKGRVHIVNHEVELSDGTRTHYEVDHSDFGAAACLIKIDTDKVALTYQYRFPLDRWIYDLPGGGRTKDETFEEAAKRECREEIGINPDTITHLVEFYPNPGRSDWSVHIFFCTSHSNSTRVNGDPSEVVHNKILAVNDVDKMIEDGKIIDPSLLIAWHTAKQKGLV